MIFYLLGGERTGIRRRWREGGLKRKRRMSKRKEKTTDDGRTKEGERTREGEIKHLIKMNLVILLVVIPLIRVL